MLGINAVRFFLMIAFVVAASPSFATSQSPDYLLIDGGVYPLYSNPLEQLYKKAKRPEFHAYLDGESSGNWRGYVAFWEIRDQRLYLIGIDSFLGKRKVFLSQLLPNRFKHGRVFADWFSGELRIPDGKELQYVHMGYGSTYERDIVYSVKDGTLMTRIVIDNTKKPMPDEWGQGKKELKKLQEWGPKRPRKP